MQLERRLGALEAATKSAGAFVIVRRIVDPGAPFAEAKRATRDGKEWLRDSNEWKTNSCRGSFAIS